MADAPAPIAILSFNRPDYLRQVLASLVAQEGAALERRNIILFQDGWHNAYSNRGAARFEDIETCIAAFRQMIPHGEVMAAPNNLGVAENYLRAEKHLFEALDAPCGYFFEDDLVLAPRYLATLDTLRAATEAVEEVGYFACYGNLQASLADQLAKPRQIRRLEHLWGFGLHRRHWQAMQPLLADYYELVLGRDYHPRARRTPEILARYRAKGIPVAVSSQDDVKKAITYHLGRVALNTNLVSARYIGEAGLHSNPQRYAAGRYAETVIPDIPRVAFDLPDAAGLAAMREREAEERRRRIAAKAAEIAAREATAAPAAVPAPAHAAAPAPATKLGKPRMDPEELALFERVLASGRRHYAEFGTGGSTLLASRAGFETLVGVESDAEWARKVREDPAIAPLVAAGRASILHADIGPVGEWGSPVGRSMAERWPRYLATMWAEWDRRGLFPDLVLVDGRFRVACCLSVALLAAATRQAPLVLLHDVQDVRPAYRRVFDAFHLEEQAGTLCVLSPRQRVSPAANLAGMLGRLFEVT